MSLVTFKDLPDTSTPLTSSNLNNNFEYLDDKIDDNQIATNTQLDQKVNKSTGIELYPIWSLPTSLDNLPTGVYMTSDVVGAPTQYTCLIVCLKYNVTRAVQMCVETGTANTWIRSISGSSWTSWRLAT